VVGRCGGEEESALESGVDIVDSIRIGSVFFRSLEGALCKTVTLLCCRIIVFKGI
jgi:hypothetical protein